MNIKTTKDLKDALRNGPYDWPGGYTEDGELV